MKACNEQRIKQFLREELTVDDQRAFETHLEQCQQCRADLEDSTADATWWNDAGHFLSDDVHDLDSISSFVALDGELASDPSASESRAAIGQFVKLLDASDDPRMLGRFGGYEIAGVIGAGGMSFVLKGFDASLNRYVAIKVLAPHLATSGAARRRFAREAQAAAAVVHENVIAIHCVAESGGLPYLVMPYERGRSLQARLNENGPLELKEILRIGMQSAAGLAAAHAQGLIHRDIKPANILLADGVERVKLTDFGLARAVDDASLTRTGMIAGTPQYMSPEQAQGEGLDHRSDLFSLGSVIYAMCTGRPPFRAESSYAILWRIADTQPKSIREISPEVPDWLCRLVERLHAKSPDDRYQTAWEVAEHLEQCLAHVQQPLSENLPGDLLPPATESSRGRHPKAWIVILLAAALFVSLLGVASVLMHPGSHDRLDTFSPASLSDDAGWTQSADGVTDSVADGKYLDDGPVLGDDALKWDDDTMLMLQELELQTQLLEQQLLDDEFTNQIGD